MAPLVEPLPLNWKVVISVPNQVISEFIKLELPPFSLWNQHLEDELELSSLVSLPCNWW